MLDIRGFAILLATAAIVASCGNGKVSQVVTQAPFKEALGKHVIAVNERPDIRNAIFHKESRSFLSFATGILCRHSGDKASPQGCDDFRDLPVHANGITFYLRPQSGTFQWLREKPVATPPAAEAPISLPVFIRALQSVGQGPNEEYQLARLQESTNEPSLLTTAQRWPVASCGKNPTTGTAHCRIGFLIKGLNVEAYYTTGSTAPVTQRDLWEIASALDRKLRSLIVT